MTKPDTREWWITAFTETEIIEGPDTERVHVIEKSAYDSLAEENARLKEVISYLPKVPTEPYERQLARELAKARSEIEQMMRVDYFAEKFREAKAEIARLEGKIAHLDQLIKVLGESK